LARPVAAWYDWYETQAAESGDGLVSYRVNTEELLPELYAELRRLAASYLRRSSSNGTLQPTALVHEAWLRLSDKDSWNNRAHFMGTAALAMRHFLARYHQNKKTLKRDGGFAIQLDDRLPGAPGSVLDSLVLEQMLRRLEEFSPPACRVIEARFFGGLTVEETAAFLHLSPATVKRHASLGQAFLARELRREPAVAGAQP
jgi:RNA polymerase sigma factor (TIGR02999 family)